MPPKKPKPKSADMQHAVKRPMSPNDLQLLNTVKQMQDQASLENKWRQRVSESRMALRNTEAKITKINQLIEVCQSNINQLSLELEEVMPRPEVIQFYKEKEDDGAAHPVGKDKPKSAEKKKPSAKDKVAAQQQAAEVEKLIAGVDMVKRTEEWNQIMVLLRKYYALERLPRESMHPRPSTPEEMTIELTDIQRVNVLADLRVRQKTNQISSPPSTKKGAKDDSLKDTFSGVFQSCSPNVTIADLSDDAATEEVFSLPCPRGLSPEAFQKVVVLRSRRLRLESAINTLEVALQPLLQRRQCIRSMSELSSYSILAVKPQLADTMSMEAALQKVRQQEDEEFFGKSKTPDVGKRR